MPLPVLTHLESLVPLSGEASPAHGLQPHDPVPQPEVALLLEVGQRAGAEEELEERETKRALIGRSFVVAVVLASKTSGNRWTVTKFTSEFDSEKSIRQVTKGRWESV